MSMVNWRDSFFRRHKYTVTPTRLYLVIDTVWKLWVLKVNTRVVFSWN